MHLELYSDPEMSVFSTPGCLTVMIKTLRTGCNIRLRVAHATAYLKPLFSIVDKTVLEGLAVWG
jgi:hypothetical protein